MLATLTLTTAWTATLPNTDTPLPATDGIRVQQTVERFDDGIRASALLTNNTGAPIALQTLSPAAIGAAAGWFQDGLDGWAVWLNGHWMFSDTVTHHFARDEHHGTFGEQLRVRTKDGIEFHSDGMLLLHDAAGNRSLLIGFVTSARQFGNVVLTTSPDERQLTSIDMRCRLEGTPVAAGGQAESETVALLTGTDPVALVERYAAMLGETMHARVPAAVPSGWNSWYFYYNRVTEDDVLRNLAALKAGNWPIEYVQIDDGYEPHQGDWLTPNDKFPHGMKFLADRIREAGYRPGLWLAPLVMHRDSRVLAEHPEFAVRDARGSIVWNYKPGPWAALDCTHPAARAWLQEVIRTIVHEWGYSVLKLDALGDASLPVASYHQPGTTSAMNLRAGLQLIREAAGEATLLLGASCPFYPSIGILDTMRVGDDIATLWFDGDRPSLQLTDHLDLLRFWMHGRLWLNDPDCIVARASDSKLTEDEVRLLVTTIALSGGLTTLSDDMTALTPARAAIARRIFPATGIAARPLDLFTYETPSIWHLPRPDGAILAFLNWHDTPSHFDVDLAPLGLATAAHAIERWTGTPRSVTGSTFREHAVPPHTARVIRFVTSGPPPDADGALLA